MKKQHGQSYQKNLRLAIKRHAQNLLVRQYKDGPPYSPYAIAEDLEVQVSEQDLSGIDGYVEVLNGRYFVVISSVSHPVRKRFTLAHELCHIWLMKQAEYGFPAPLIRYRSANKLPGLHQDPVEEYLCNYFASELLMPREDLERRFLGQKIAPSTIFHLASEFHVSKQTAAIQMVNTFKSTIVACCLWSLESLWPLPQWWTGNRTPYKSELLKIEALVGEQAAYDMWETYGTKRQSVIIEAEPSERKRLSMVVIRSRN